MQITYDNIGNPINYLGANLAWEGRQLKSYENDTYFITYEYDENGMRYRTTVVDKTAEEETVINIDYVWSGGKLVSMVLSSGDISLSAKYLYNNSDEVIGFDWFDGETPKSTYFYLKNLQGDITGIVSYSGELQVSYTYDVWGKQSHQYHADKSSIIGMFKYFEQIYMSALNPFGYRGYCLDAYSGLYYLQSRYYDPNTGRFINADDTNYLNATGTVLGCNLFAYCENDAVNKVDPSGTISMSTIKSYVKSLGKKAWKIGLSLFNKFVWKKPAYLGLKLIEVIIDALINLLPFAKAFKFVSYKAVTKSLVEAAFKKARKGISTFLSKMAFKISFNTLFSKIVNSLFWKYTSRLLTVGGIICLIIDNADGVVDYYFNFSKFS